MLALWKALEDPPQTPVLYTLRMTATGALGGRAWILELERACKGILALLLIVVWPLERLLYLLIGNKNCLSHRALLMGKVVALNVSSILVT